MYAGCLLGNIINVSAWKDSSVSKVLALQARERERHFQEPILKSLKQTNEQIPTFWLTESQWVKSLAAKLHNSSPEFYLQDSQGAQKELSSASWSLISMHMLCFVFPPLNKYNIRKN